MFIRRRLTPAKILREMEDIFREELNVKDVVFRENEDELVEYSAKANFKVLGKELGKDMKAAASKIASLNSHELQSLMEGAVLSIDLGTRTLDLTSESVIVQRSEKESLKVLNEGSLTVALDPEITSELLKEGTVRDIVRSIQNLRKEEGLEVTDRISLFLHGGEEVLEAVRSFDDYLVTETLARGWFWEKRKESKEYECGDTTCFISLQKAE